MKTFRMTILLLGIPVLMFAQSKNEAAIRNVIESETRSYHTNKDRKVYISFWQIKPESLYFFSSLDGNNLFMTSDDFKTGIANNAFPPADSAAAYFSNIVVKASGNIGWATYDEKMVFPDGRNDYLHSFRCLEKIGGVWKIISASDHQYKP